MSEDIFCYHNWVSGGMGVGVGGVDTGVPLALGGQRPGRLNILKCIGQHEFSS